MESFFNYWNHLYHQFSEFQICIEFRGIWVPKFWWKFYSILPISTVSLFVSLFHQLMFYYQYLHYTICISGITHCIKISFKISFQCSLKLILIKRFHGTFFRVPWNILNNIWTTPVVPCNSMELKQQNLKFHGILSRSKVPWNSMELFPYSRVPWNSMELLIFPKRSSMEFHGTWWIWYCCWYLIDDYMLFG